MSMVIGISHYNVQDDVNNIQLVHPMTKITWIGRKSKL